MFMLPLLLTLFFGLPHGTQAAGLEECAEHQIAAVIDFEGFDAGAEPEEFCFGGKGISSSDPRAEKFGVTDCFKLAWNDKPRNPATSPRGTGPMIYDAACGGPANGTDDSGCTGNDEDLFQPEEGKVLIFNGDGSPGSQDPNDHAFGGIFRFRFDRGNFMELFSQIHTCSITLLDYTRHVSPVTFKARRREDGKVIVEEFDLFVEEEDRIPSQLNTVELGYNDVHVLEVRFRSGGAITSINMCLEEQTTSSSSTSTSTLTSTSESSSTSTLTSSSVSTSTSTSTTGVCPVGLSPVVIDFEALAAGTQPVNVCFAGGGISTSSSFPFAYNNSVCADLTTNGDNNGAMIFDATCGQDADGTDTSGCSGRAGGKGRKPGETDLFQPLQGNVLILQTNRPNYVDKFSAPSDDRDGGCFTLDFTTDSFRENFESVLVASVTLLDVINRRAEITARLEDGSELFLKSAKGENGGIQTMDINADKVKSIDFCLMREGAVDDILLCLAPVESPSSRLLAELPTVDRENIPDTSHTHVGMSMQSIVLV
mmetsp:Transcript_60104/g.143227  ORF Transcript_60104/g.143227 Transcript_60104/m.143227 type:complete len:539 (-) Transcript_60104:193-1809(-)